MSYFWGIGVGPGDSDLITIKAVKAIKKLQILYVPAAHGDSPSLAESIAKPYFSDNLVIKKRHFPMVNNLKVKRESWQDISNEIIQDVKANNEVGFLTLGDPSIYSTYSYITKLVANDINIQTIAGISSFSQIAASLSQPLVLNDESLEIISANASLTKLQQAIKLNNNVVIMKIAINFSEIYKILQEQDLLAQTIIVERVSMERQRVKTLDQYTVDSHLPYFTTAFLRKG